jgi:hypothetical protein
MLCNIGRNLPPTPTCSAFLWAPQTWSGAASTWEPLLLLLLLLLKVLLLLLLLLQQQLMLVVLHLCLLLLPLPAYLVWVVR